MQPGWHRPFRPESQVSRLGFPVSQPSRPRLDSRVSALSCWTAAPRRVSFTNGQACQPGGQIRSAGVSAKAATLGFPWEYLPEDSVTWSQGPAVQKRGGGGGVWNMSTAGSLFQEQLCPTFPPRPNPGRDLLLFPTTQSRPPHLQRLNEGHRNRTQEGIISPFSPACFSVHSYSVQHLLCIGHGVVLQTSQPLRVSSTAIISISQMGRLRHSLPLNCPATAHLSVSHLSDSFAETKPLVQENDLYYLCIAFPRAPEASQHTHSKCPHERVVGQTCIKDGEGEGKEEQPQPRPGPRGQKTPGEPRGILAGLPRSQEVSCPAHHQSAEPGGWCLRGMKQQCNERRGHSSPPVTHPSWPCSGGGRGSSRC